MVLKAYSKLYLQGPYGMLGTRPRLAVCKQVP